MRPGVARRPEYRPRLGDRQTRSVGTITARLEPCHALSHHIGCRSNLHLRLMLVDRLALSEPDEMRPPLLLSGRIDAVLAASGGVASVNDAVKYPLAGAGVVMAASALPRCGA